MLMLRSSPTSVFMGSTLPHLKAMRGDVRTELNPPIWDSERSVHNISISPRSNPHPSLSLFRDSFSFLVDSEGRSETQDDRYSSPQFDPYGVPLFCTSRGCRPAQVSESEYISGGSGIQRRGENCEAAEDENSKRRTDMYYQSMFEANPGNPLLLSNYARFLHEVQHNMAKAEEYYERAILASPGDAEVLSLYDKFIWEVLSLYAKFKWETRKDAARAEVYFDEAVKVDPDNCYIISSYAHFLWEAEEGEEDRRVDLQNVSATTFVGGWSC